jgi:hypothetical protein
MPWNLLVLPLLGGFLLLRRCHYFRIKAQRYENYRLVFESAVWGVILSIGGRLLAFGLHFVPGLRLAEPLVAHIAPYPFVGTTFLAFALGPALASLANWRVDEFEAKDKAIAQTGDKLLELLINAMDQTDAVMFTLDSRKVYVGYVWESPNLETEMTYVVLLPVMSGYRDANTLTVKFNTNYISLWKSENKEKVAAQEFLVLIPVGSIKTASIFDLDIYETHFSSKSVV